MTPLMSTTNLIYLIVLMVFLLGAVAYALVGMKKRKDAGLPDSEPLIAHDDDDDVDPSTFTGGAHRA